MDWKELRIDDGLKGRSCSSFLEGPISMCLTGIFETIYDCDKDK